MAGKGKPRAFKDEDELLTEFKKYIEHCEWSKRFPNIAGFCAYKNMTRETFYKQKEYYSDTYNKIMQILEDEVLQDNSYRSQLYLKNKFDYKDKTAIESSGTLEINITGQVKEWSK